MVRKADGGHDAVVMDSSFLLAYYNSRDVHHPAAARAMAHVAAGKWGRALLLEYVFLELVTVLLARRDIATAVEVGNSVLEAEEFDFVPCSELFVDTLREFSKQRNTTLSFADAAIVVAARAHAGGRVVTFDADFRGVPGLSVLPA